MSRLGDILRKALNTAPPALGFRPPAPSRPRMVLIAGITEPLDDVSSYVTGADAVILSSNIKVKDAKGLVKALPMPWGVFFDGSATLKQVESFGSDFAVFAPDNTGLDIVSSERLGKVLVVNPAFENALLHSLNEMPLEALYLEREPRGALTFLELMHCRRLADLVAKPLLLPVVPDMPPSQIKVLWEMGVDALVVTATASGEIAGLKRSLDDLILPTRRKWLKAAQPLVPVLRPAPSLTQREEDEEEDEE